MLNRAKVYLGLYGVQILSGLIACLGMISDGMQFAFASPATPKLLANDSIIPMTQTETEWIAQSYIAGCVMGAILSYFIFNNISRKLSILVSCLPIGTAWLGILFARTPTLLFVSRCIGGVGRNMAYVSVPMYLGEIADPNIRGILGTFIYIMMNSGALMVYCILPYSTIQVTASIGLVLVIIQICLLYFLPESPYYLLKIEQPEQAEIALKTLRCKDDIREELKDLKAAVERQVEQAGFLKLFTVKTNLKAIGILLFLRIAQMFAGVSVMTMNIHTIFENVGSGISVNASAIIYSCLMLSSSVCTIGVMDRFGRKTLMIISCIISSLALFSEGSFFFMQQYGFNTDGITWLPLVSTFIFVYGYRIGLGTVPMVMVGELLSVSVKVQGVILSDIIYTSSSFSTNTIFYYTRSRYGMFAPFWIFGSVCMLTALFSKLFVPETRGKTLEEIQIILMGKKGQKQVP